MKKFLEHCPRCGYYLCVRITRGRKHQHQCHNQDCEWEGEPFAPEPKAIKPETTFVPVVGSGYHFHIYDKYGYVVLSSRAYQTKPDAQDEIRKELGNGKRDKEGGPYTAVLWPPPVKVKGDVFK